MIKQIACLTALVLTATLLLAGCASSEPPPETPEFEASLPSNSSSSQAPAPKIEVTQALMDELMGYNSEGLDAFIETHPDFLRVLVSRAYYKEDSQLILLETSPDRDLTNALQNAPRMETFMANYKAGIPDSIAVISSGSPMPLWLTVYAYDGTGKTVEATSYDPTLEWTQEAVVPELRETDTQWLLGAPEWANAFPKHGYEAITAGAGGEVTQEQAQTTLMELITRYDPGVTALRPVEEKTYQNMEQGELHYMFEGGDAGEHLFAVAKDLSRFYEIEHAHGMWRLWAQAVNPA